MNTPLPSTNAPRIGLWMFVTLASLCAVQVLMKPKPEKRIPGSARGDLVLEKDALPGVIGPWHLTRFQPALAPEKLRKGQYWWTHSWSYSSAAMSAYVAFDQADWDCWHELTICYRAVDWQMKNRRIVPANSDNAGPWNVVLAEFERVSGDRALVAFSLFDQDGQPIESPDSGFTNTESEKTVLEKFQARFDSVEVHNRVLQTQVFAQHHGDLSEELVQEIIELHLQTRNGFRDAWLEHLRNRETVNPQ